MEPRSLLLDLRALLRDDPEDRGRVLVDHMRFHSLCVSARAGMTVAEPVGRAFHELEKVAYRLGQLRPPDWSLPRPLVGGVIARGLGERLRAGDRRALRVVRAQS